MTIRQMVETTAILNAASEELRSRNDAYDAGYDCALNGANDKNCHFGWFSSPSFTREWERGKRDGEADARKKARR